MTAMGAVGLPTPPRICNGTKQIKQLLGRKLELRPEGLLPA